MADAALKACKCKNDFQDKMYGMGIRVCNPNTKGGHRCTVCGTSFGGGDKKK